MITTPAQYRQALHDANHISSKDLPPFSLPRDTTCVQTIPVEQAFLRLGDSRAGFLGRDTATLVHKIL